MHERSLAHNKIRYEVHKSIRSKRIVAENKFIVDRIAKQNKH